MYKVGFVCLGFSLALILVLTGCSGVSMGSGPSQLTVQVTGSGAVVSSPRGINCGTTCSGSFPAGTAVTLTATANPGSAFVNWGGACSGSKTCTVTLNSNMSVSATFASSPVLALTLSGTGSGTVSSNPAGINCGTTCKAAFNSGTSITLTATPAANSTFAGWSGACSGTALCKVNLTASTSVTALFTAISASPALTVSVSGSGTVTSNPPGINCGSVCSALFNSGTSVTLTATPAAGSTFAGWSGACSGTGTCTLTLTSNASVTASFNVSGPTLTVSLPGPGAGTITSNPTGINCGSVCSASFNTGTSVTLSESPATGTTFAGWSGGGCSGTGSSCTVTVAGNTTVTAIFNAINHIIFLAQENRSFDHYFGQMRQWWAQNGYPDQSFDGLPQFNPTSGTPPLYGAPPTNPGCDPNFPPPNTCVIDSNSPTITSYPLITQCIENPSPFWNEAHNDWDYADPTGNNPAQLNGFVWTAAYDARSSTNNYYDTAGMRAMGYYTGDDLNYYYFMASNFGTSDRWFHPAMTRTEPNRQYLIAATSQGYVYPIGGNPPKDKNLLTATTIFQELQNAGISWKIYVNPMGSGCSGPPYSASCLLNHFSYVSGFQWGQNIPTDYPNNIGTIGPTGTCGSSPCDFENDLANGTLPQVAQIEPASDAGLDEHPSDVDNSPENVQLGANYVSGLINSVMNSSAWSSSVFILTYDENGGLYDHVSPQPAVSPDGIAPVDLKTGDICTSSTGPTCDFVYTGYRVPLIVVSPYTKKNYVSHTVADNTAILKFIETRFGLSALNSRDAAQPDMTEFFDFTNPPWMTPPTPPAQNTSGACYLNKLP
jgi:phospholipase C